MNTLEFTLLALSSLFVILDPIAVVPAFLAMTAHDTAEQRIRMARLACIVAAIILLLFSTTGRLLFKLLGVTLPAFQIAGSIVLLLVALDMLRAKRSAVQETAEDTNAGAAKDDIAITPLAIPMLAGPGAITTSILLHSRAESIAQQIILGAAIVVVCTAAFYILSWAAHGAKRLNPIVLRVVTRVMGLLLASVAAQFMIDALQTIRLGSPQP